MYKNTIIFGLFLFSIFACNSEKAQLGGNPIPTTFQGKPIPVLHTNEEVVEFIKKVLDEPIPADYVAPAYITKGLPITVIQDSLAARFPLFYNKEYEDYRAAVQADPAQYLLMMNESKTIRKYYDRETQY